MTQSNSLFFDVKTDTDELIFLNILLQQITVYVKSTTVLILCAIFVVANCGYCSNLIISKKSIVVCNY
jgi:uncharacterized oligopeptide transporter (OPT) family protein